MNVTQPEKFKIDKKSLTIYTSIIVVCIIAIIIAFYVQFYARIDILGTSADKPKEKKEEEIEELRERI